MYMCLYTHMYISVCVCVSVCWLSETVEFVILCLPECVKTLRMPLVQNISHFLIIVEESNYNGVMPVMAVSVS